LSPFTIRALAYHEKIHADVQSTCGYTQLFRWHITTERDAVTVPATTFPSRFEVVTTVIEANATRTVPSCRRFLDVLNCMDDATTHRRPNRRFLSADEPAEASSAITATTELATWSS
jgi:hypothetical protein